MGKNKEIINTIERQLVTLKDIMKSKNGNQKAVIKRIIETYELLQKYTEDDNLYKEELSYYKILDSDNDNLRYKNGNNYAKLLKKELNDEYNNFNVITKQFDDNKNSMLNLILLDELDINFNDDINSLFNNLKNVVGINDIFIEYTDELDNPAFMDFENYASENALCIRLIFTQNSTITYYGGKNYESILTAINNIDSYAIENGVNFNTKNYQKKK